MLAHEKGHNWPFDAPNINFYVVLSLINFSFLLIFLNFLKLRVMKN